MMRVSIMFVATALLAVFLCLPLAPQAWGECVTPQRVAAFIKTNNPDAERVAQLTGREAARFLERWNALPPMTSLPADLVWIYDAHSRATVLIVLFNNGCLLAVDEQPKAHFHQLFPSVPLVKGQYT